MRIQGKHILLGYKGSFHLWRVAQNISFSFFHLGKQGDIACVGRSLHGGAPTWTGLSPISTSSILVWRFSEIYFSSHCILLILISPDSVFPNSPTHWNFFEPLNQQLTELFRSFRDMHRTAKNRESPDVHRFPAKVQQGNLLPSYFSSHNISECPFWGLFNGTYFAILCFFGWFCCLKWLYWNAQ